MHTKVELLSLEFENSSSLRQRVMCTVTTLSQLLEPVLAVNVLYDNKAVIRLLDCQYSCSLIGYNQLYSRVNMADKRNEKKR